MRVKENNEKNTVNYEELNAGDCFRWKSKLYIKVNCNQEAVCLKDGNILCNMCGITVTSVNAEVQIID